jgi:hypothetical protein
MNEWILGKRTVNEHSFFKGYISHMPEFQDKILAVSLQQRKLVFYYV